MDEAPSLAATPTPSLLLPSPPPPARTEPNNNAATSQGSLVNGATMSEPRRLERVESQRSEGSQPPAQSKFQIIEAGEKAKEESEDELDDSIASAPPLQPTPPPTNPHPLPNPHPQSSSPSPPPPPPAPQASPPLVQRAGTQPPTSSALPCPSLAQRASTEGPTAPPNTPQSMPTLDRIMANKTSPLATAAAAIAAADAAVAATPAIRKSRFERVRVPVNKAIGRWQCSDWKEGTSQVLAPTPDDRDPMIVLDKKKDGSGNSSKANSLHVPGAAPPLPEEAPRPPQPHPQPPPQQAQPVPSSQPLPPQPSQPSSPDPLTALAQTPELAQAPAAAAAAAATAAAAVTSSPTHVPTISHTQATPPSPVTGEWSSASTSTSTSLSVSTPTLGPPSSLSALDSSTASLMAQFMARTPLAVTVPSLSHSFLEGILPGAVAPAQSPQMQESLAMMAQQMVGGDPNASGGGGGAGGAVVAIDNKIEQAMDLVKTHLMYAVREEIEALRGKIVDLEKKLGWVEAENRSLRAAASPEVLAQIEAQTAAAAASTATATPQPATPATAAAGGNPPLSAVAASQSQSQCPPTAPTQQPSTPASQAPQ